MKFLQPKTGKLTVLDAAALDLEAYPGWLRAPYRTGAHRLARCIATRCPMRWDTLFPRAGTWGGKILMKLLGIGDNVLDDYRWRRSCTRGATASMCPCWPPLRRSTAAYIGVLADDGAGLHFAPPAGGRRGYQPRACDARHQRAQLHRAGRGGRPPLCGNNGRETAQYQALLCLTPGDYAMMEQYDLAHTSIHSWLDAYHRPSAAGCRSLWTFPASTTG